MITVILLSHNKPNIVTEAILSVFANDFSELVLIDSGPLYNAGYFATLPYLGDKRVKLIRSHETQVIRDNGCVASYCFNQAFACQYVTQPVTQYLCDDDYLYPGSLAALAEFYRANPEAMAVYCTEDIGRVERDGTRRIVGERVADRERKTGEYCCVVDYLQFSHRREVWEQVQHPEGYDTRTYADGVFMEAVSKVYKVYNLPSLRIGVNRRTPWSVNGAT